MTLKILCQQNYSLSIFSGPKVHLNCSNTVVTRPFSQMIFPSLKRFRWNVTSRFKYTILITIYAADVAFGSLHNVVFALNTLDEIPQLWEPKPFEYKVMTSTCSSLWWSLFFRKRGFYFRVLKWNLLSVFINLLETVSCFNVWVFVASEMRKSMSIGRVFRG